MILLRSDPIGSLRVRSDAKKTRRRIFKNTINRYGTTAENLFAKSDSCQLVTLSPKAIDDPCVFLCTRHLLHIIRDLLAFPFPAKLDKTRNRVTTRSWIPRSDERDAPFAPRPKGLQNARERDSASKGKIDRFVGTRIHYARANFWNFPAILSRENQEKPTESPAEPKTRSQICVETRRVRCHSVRALDSCNPTPRL
ncbi:hypothetical protein EVAR_49982_1 [Eumeta japonica]|uniref:Uncharacterized protein n=1 Tax=Eumeta variegata TaxID=151549 RepID=A0A4C1XML6_EUMVA|nr:hypothetical protein EVAR_49982_1 [Eumeta japonica]